MDFELKGTGGDVDVLSYEAGEISTKLLNKPPSGSGRVITT